MSERSLTCIDLFCGCGGFSLGMRRAGFKVLAAIDFNEEAIATFKVNFPTETLVLRKDLTKFTPTHLAMKLGVNHVDVIVGGPPCQGYSMARQVDAANHGSRVKRDKRRYLFRAFLDYVAAFRPKIFVMENVPGIQSAAKGKFFTMVQAEARKLGYRVQAQVEEAWKLGVPQKRRRQLVIGVRNDIPGFFPSDLEPAKRALIGENSPVLWDAIGDLPPLQAGAGSEESEYDLELRRSQIAERGERVRHYLENVLEIGLAGKLTAHRARPHNDRDIRDFNRMEEGETADQAIARGEEMEFPYNRSIFLDRYTRQHREDLCSTIVAHLAKDGLMFIHPTQCRTLTPREAARVQTFPDWFHFPIARTHQFRVIGNAVPPLVAEAVAEEIREFLSENPQNSGRLDQPPTTLSSRSRIPASRVAAAQELQNLAGLDRRTLRSLEHEDFLAGWHALLFLFPGLHPNNARDHGDVKEEFPRDQLPLPGFEDIFNERYVRSGWPVALALIGDEAWRRYRAGEISEADFYCVDAQRAGLALPESPGHAK